MFLFFWDLMYESLLGIFIFSVLFIEDFLGGGMGIVIDGFFKNWKYDKVGVFIRNIVNSGQFFQ